MSAEICVTLLQDLLNKFVYRPTLIDTESNIYDITGARRFKKYS